MSESPTRKKGLSMGAMFAIGVGIFVACAVAWSQSRAETIRFPDEANARFSVTVTGEGPDVILIPGLGSPAAVWDGTVAKFKDQYRFHVLNLSGFAGEPAAANGQGDVLAPSVEAVDAYIKANDLKQPVVAGHSLGGLMALMLAKSHPEDASELVIVDALPFIGLIFDPNATAQTIAPQATAMRDSLINAPADAFAAQQRAGAGRMVTTPAHQETVVGWSLASDRRVFAQAMYEDLVLDLRPDLAKITTPTTVIVPVASHYGMTQDATLAFYKGAYAGQPNVTFVAVDNSLHFVMLDQPETFATALEAALK
ncbi:alpha/beta hydrolase fold family protein [Asticcacaulis biprosthecium C19]|uniref:Alpha/beta hydrolase fold family protein n=1 Tax=Asticcacaulis biprosthecium C19 TaxID=715226 RepID=F4QTS9_9CAUL|nr:alpha/beta hydrolase [Asticcacaulis biprosthecium]EGF89229.1 alpha/beta hydrolase fold family protein [Asticcacaulis biprosthecium C19]